MGSEAGLEVRRGRSAGHMFEWRVEAPEPSGINNDTLLPLTAVKAHI